MSAESTRTLLFGLFVLADRPGLTAAELVRLAAPLGVRATNVRSHLSRMTKDGSLTRRGRPRTSVYSPSRTKLHVIDVIKRRTRSVHERWKGDWLLLVLPGAMARAERRRMDQRLRFDGFRPWGRHAWLRPAWPARWSAERAAVHADRSGGVCVRGALASRKLAQDAERLFDLDQLDREARRLLALVRRCAGRARDPASALAMRAAAGGPIAQFISKEPGLPPELWGRRTAVRRLVAAFERFEGRARPLSRRHVDVVLGRQGREKGR